MGYDLYVYTKDRPEDPESFVNLRPWSPSGEGWGCRTRHWQVVVNAPQSIDSQDENESVIAEIGRVRPEVRYRTDVNVEGRLSDEAIVIAIATAQKLAHNLCGIVYDPQQDCLVLPVSEGLLASAKPEIQRPKKERSVSRGKRGVTEV